MSELKPCPCGKTPKKLHITKSGDGYKYGVASGDCCNGWQIEFRAVNYEPFSNASYQAACDTWNGASRGLPEQEES